MLLEGMWNAASEYFIIFFTRDLVTTGISAVSLLTVIILVCLYVNTTR